MIYKTAKILGIFMFSLLINIKIEENKILIQGIGKINTNS